jgi:ABC-type glycerol-3-phosphate transport system permease component
MDETIVEHVVENNAHHQALVQHLASGSGADDIAGSMVVPYSQQMAAALLTSIPTLLVYLLLGRFFMRGLMAGALKG